ncbi:conserved hypothetical protein [Nitrosopumilaceae archaeon]|nr:hypothetical protein [Nitrosopumilus sp.]CAI9832797.1 conserved hypothetical protein [Nitrosopumilaceae archaeon]MDA7944383.1 hypothetical protein [Nitrosopumilus sp.]MDA7954135.1 hypothetical protein [Nitrosopumilus sp.]MDA7973063.1 hypothetical protein [Nitrosopumilus sp.]
MVSVAVPGSSLSDEPNMEGRARKASVIARACAIFAVDQVLVYADGDRRDGERLAALLRYAEAPQYLRRALYPRTAALRYAGVMSPLGISSHSVTPDPRRITAGDAREAVVVSARGRRFIDAGLGRLLPYHGRAPPGRRITVMFRGGPPGLPYKEVGRSEAPGYWGYVVRERAGLRRTLAEWEGRVIIASRRGRPAGRALRAPPDGGTLLVFGSPERDVHEILGGRAGGVRDATTVDFFPGQSTRTVRLEEALLGALSVINSMGGTS